MFKDGDPSCVYSCVAESQTRPTVVSHTLANDSFDSYGDKNNWLIRIQNNLRSFNEVIINHTTSLRISREMTILH